MRLFDKVTPLLRLLAGVSVFVWGVAGPGRLAAQVPPGETWRTLDTEHFRVTFPDSLESLARRAGQRAEVAWGLLAEKFLPPPSTVVDLVVTDHADISNGFSRVFPSDRVVVFAPPPVDGFGLPFMDDWMELVITHEMVHIFHQDYTRGLSKGVRTVFGRVPLEWPFFPGSAMPGWLVEGAATYFESALTASGRVRGSFHEMVVRTAILENRFESIDQSSGDAPVWPGGQRYYIYGSLFLNWYLQRHGEGTMGALADEVAGQWIPYRLDAAADRVSGSSISDAWMAWRGELEARYSALRDSLSLVAPITQGEILTGEGYYAWDPEPSPSGSGVAFARLDGRSDPQIRFLDPDAGTQEKLFRTNALSHLSWGPAGELVFSQIDYIDPYRIRQDLYVGEPDGRVVRLTKGARLDHPHVAPGGGSAVAVQDGEGSNRLVLVDLDTGTLTPLNDFQPGELWAYPRYSPDGRWIAASRWRSGAYFDVVILDSHGRLRWEVTHDRAIDNAPAWSPDGSWLLWSSDRTGIPNLFVVGVDPASGEPGRTAQVTNVLGGVAYPAVSADGRWIYFASYASDGWHMERIPFQPSSWFEPLPLASSFSVEVDTGRLQAEVDGEVQPYSALPTLRPTYWAPTFREGDDVGDRRVLGSGFGFSTSGEDLLGRHAYSASAVMAKGVARTNGGASYTFSGFENPVLGASFSQFYDADARPWIGLTQEGDSVPLYLVERDRAASVGATVRRVRSRWETAFTLSASHVWEHRVFLEQDLEESTRFRLSRPDVRFAEARGVFTFGNARSFPFSISPEDGAGVLLRGRIRRALTLADSLRGRGGFDGSYRDLTGQLTAYRGFRLPGFGNHVLGVRGSGGIAGGPGADAFHFEVGGASGSGLPLQFVELGHGLLFPVRGYATATRWGRIAWSGSLEYRFPVALVNRGAGLFPLHLDWISGTVFLDGGNAWGPDMDPFGFHNPRRDPLASIGGEFTVRILPLWFQTMDLRFGLAAPLVEGDGSQFYLRVGRSF